MELPSKRETWAELQPAEKFKNTGKSPDDTHVEDCADNTKRKRVAPPMSLDLGQR